MIKKRIISLILIILLILPVFSAYTVFAGNTEQTQRTVYLHAQGHNPDDTANSSTVYLGDTADVFLAVDNPNKGEYVGGVHKDPQYDMNGYTMQIAFDPEYFDFASDNTDAPIDYKYPKTCTGEGTEDAYYVYLHGSGTREMNGITYKTAHITVFYQGCYFPQKTDGKRWYNIAKLPLVPKKTGSSTVVLTMDDGTGLYPLELFAKNVDEKLENQTFSYDVINSGYHTIIIKDKSRPEPPVPSPVPGSYTTAQKITLAAEPGCSIFYTVDGSDPKSNGTEFTNGMSIDVEFTTEIKCYAKRNGDGKTSNVVTYLYEILPESPLLFNNLKKLIPTVYNESDKYKVYVSDKNIYQNIEDGSEVYYTFSDAGLDGDIDGSNPDDEWVKIEKGAEKQFITIDRNRTVRLVTKKLDKFSDVSVYCLGIKPEPVKSSHASGEYSEKIDITLSTDSPNAVIYYTIDGKNPLTDGMEYDSIPISLTKDTVIRAVAIYEGVYSEITSYYYLFDFKDDYGIDAFYPSGVYEGNVNVTLMPENPGYKIKYKEDDGEWKDYDGTVVIGKNTFITAKAIEYDEEGKIISEGDERTFIYKIRPHSPMFAPEGTQFTNTDEIAVYTPDITDAESTKHYELWYTLDGSDPITSPTKLKGENGVATILIKNYTVVKAVVVKDGESYSNVITHSYDIVKTKPIKPITTLTPGQYSVKIGDSEKYYTEFMPVAGGVKIYYTVGYDGEFCSDPVPNTEGTIYFDGTPIDIKGDTVIKAVSVNAFGAKSDIGIFSYNIGVEAPVTVPSTKINGDKLPVVPVDVVKDAIVKYEINGESNEFVCGNNRFYLDLHTGNAYEDQECLISLGDSVDGDFEKAELELQATLDNVYSVINQYVYSLTDDPQYVSSPYTDKTTGTYDEIKIDDDNNLLYVKLMSLNENADIMYKLSNETEWKKFDDDGVIKLDNDAVLMAYCQSGEYRSNIVSYAYNFVPLPPIIDLPSGTYAKKDEPKTEIHYDPLAPTNRNYKIFYRENGDSQDYQYLGIKRDIDHTMSFKAYVKETLDDGTVKVSKNTINYYIVQNNTTGNVLIEYPYDTPRISVDKLTLPDYAEGIKLFTPNSSEKIGYYYSYTKTDGQTVVTKDAIFESERPIIPTVLMDDITIFAWLEDENGRIYGTEETFKIDFIHLNSPETSLTESEKTEFPKGTKYTLIDEYPDDDNIILYYTLDGSDPADSDNKNRIAYNGEELILNGTQTIRTVYFDACGTCAQCKDGAYSDCWYPVYGIPKTYKYTVPSRSGGGGGGGGSHKSTVGMVSGAEIRKYTKDIFGNEHPTHIGFINGYPDGSVQPDGNITREEIAAILYRISIKPYDIPNEITGDMFSDVGSGRWSVGNIEYLARHGVINGYPDGSYRPGEKLTRGEFASLVKRFCLLENADEINEEAFNDISEHWAKADIMTIYTAGLIDGYEDQSFRPEKQITRAEVMKIINRILGRKPVEEYVKSIDVNPFNDLDMDKWFYTEVIEATITHNYYLDEKDVYEYKWENWK